MINPTNDYILVTRNDPDTVSTGGVIIPDIAQSSQEGTVLAVGPGRVGEDGVRIRPDVTPGDTVLFSDDPRTRQEFTHEGQEYLILKPAGVLAVIQW